MCSSNIILCYFMLLLVVSSSKSQRNSTDDDERSNNSTVPYDSLERSGKYLNDEIELTESIQCNSCENSFMNDDKKQYESLDNSTKHDSKINDSRNKSWRHIIKNGDQNNQNVSMEFHVNSTEINDFMLHQVNKNITMIEDGSNSTSNKLYGNSNVDDYNNSTINACRNITCIQLCCPLGEKMTFMGNCIAGPTNYIFPRVYANEDKMLNELFPLTVRDPCAHHGLGRNMLKPNEYVFLINGYLYQGADKFFSPTNYCIVILERLIFDVIVCVDQVNTYKIPIYVSACLLVSLPFFLVTFIVYSILPELRNMHGYTLRAHVASLFIMYAIMYPGHQSYALNTWKYCVPLAYIFNFSVLSSFFWLNVTCFDIWWTFRELRSNRISLKLNKMRFVKYSLYAWGIPFIHTVFCAIMDNISETQQNWIRPNMCKTKFWIDNYALKIYIFLPIGATIISNICFFIATALAISNQKKLTAHQMRHSESKQHNENKQWYNMYLKLFILMGLTWAMELIADMFDVTVVPPVVWYPTNMLNGLQGVIIFIIFVCTKKNMQLLLKQFSFWFCKIPRSNDNIENTSISIVSGTLSMQEISSPN